MASRQENPETAALRNRLCSASHFLLECFGSMHYLKMSKCICFVLKDVGTYFLHQMDLTSLEKIFREIPFTTLDELGFLKKITSDRLDNALRSTKVFGLVTNEASSERQRGVTKGELLLLFFVCYLSINRKTHYKKICKNLCDWAPPGVSQDMLSTSDPSKLEYFKKYKEHFRMDCSGSLELHNSFHSLFEDIPFDSGSSQNKNHGDSNHSEGAVNGRSNYGFIEGESQGASNVNVHLSYESFEEKASICINSNSHNSQEEHCDNTPSVWGFDVSEELFKSLNLPINSLDILTERIIDGIAYLSNFFNLNVYSSLLQVVIHVIKRGWIFFKLPQSYQEAVIKKCFESFCVDKKGNVTYSHVLEKHKYILSSKRQCLICFTYIISEERSMHYQEAWKQYRKPIGRNYYLEDSKQLSYFKNRPLFFLVNDSGFVSIQNIKTIDFVPIIMPEKSSKITCSDRDEIPERNSSSLDNSPIKCTRSRRNSSSSNYYSNASSDKTESPCISSDLVKAAQSVRALGIGVSISSANAEEFVPSESS
ncbi:hypothetical protein JTE90_017607 [Oedothorax gibbosus]|uniref:Uncharacterized protein n=1 Tax=Oedothorax gibbosus TaxID=931172 RepID=A0AAV6U5L0_9ARAC|nr:hypothetical protein JTE90_017607 [Oedothorax gibbosus]